MENSFSLSKSGGDVKDSTISEINLMKEQINLLTNSSVHKSVTSDQIYWNKLIDLNIRAGTLACMWCLKAQIVKKVSLAFYKWKYTSMFNPPVTVSKRRISGSVTKSNGSISAALESAMSLVNRMKTPIKNEEDRRVSEQHTESSSELASPSVNTSIQRNHISNNNQSVDTQDIIACEQLEDRHHQSVLTNIMDTLQYNKTNSEHLDRYLRDAMIHKETDFEMKRKILLAMSHDIIDRGTQLSSPTKTDTPPYMPNTVRSDEALLTQSQFGDQSAILDTTHSTLRTLEDLAFSPLKTSRSSLNLSTRSFRGGEALQRQQSTSKLSHTASVRSMQSSALEKRLMPTSRASSMSAINMSNLQATAGSFRSPTARLVNTLIDAYGSEEDDASPGQQRATKSKLTPLQTISDDDGDSQGTYSPVSNYRDEDTENSIKRHPPRSTSPNLRTRNRSMSLDHSHHSSQQASVGTRVSHVTSVHSVAPPLAHHVKGGTFGRSPARGRDSADDKKDFKYLMFKNTDSGNYVRQLISPRNSNDGRSKSAGRTTDVRGKTGHISSSSSITTATGAFSSNNTASGTTNRLHNTSSHHPLINSVFTFNEDFDLNESRQSSRSQNNRSKSTRTPGSGTKRSHQTNTSLDASYRSNSHNNNSVPLYMLPTNSYMKKILSPEEQRHYHEAVSHAQQMHFRYDHGNNHHQPHSHQGSHYYHDPPHHHLSSNGSNNGSNHHDNSHHFSHHVDHHHHHHQQQSQHLQHPLHSKYDDEQHHHPRVINSNKSATASRPTSANRSIVDHFEQQQRQRQSGTSNNRPYGSGDVDHNQRSVRESVDGTTAVFSDASLNRDLRRVLDTDNTGWAGDSSDASVQRRELDSGGAHPSNVYQNLHQSLTQLSGMSPSEPHLSQTLNNISNIVHTLAADADSISVTSANRYGKNNAGSGNTVSNYRSMSSVEQVAQQSFSPIRSGDDDDGDVSRHLNLGSQGQGSQDGELNLEHHRQYNENNQHDQHQHHQGERYDSNHQQRNQRAMKEYDNYHFPRQEQHHQSQQHSRHSFDNGNSHRHHQHLQYAEDVPEYSNINNNDYNDNYNDNNTGYYSNQQQQQQYHQQQQQSLNDSNLSARNGKQRIGRGGNSSNSASKKKKPAIDPAQARLFYGHLVDRDVRRDVWNRSLRR